MKYVLMTGLFALALSTTACSSAGKHADCGCGEAVKKEEKKTCECGKAGEECKCGHKH